MSSVMSVLVRSERFGDVECDDAATVVFPDGLLGFEEEREFVVMPADPEGIYSWLQSTRTPSLAFLTTSPTCFFADYAVEIDDAEVAEIEILDESEAMVLAIVTIAEDRATANLLGPIVVNTRTRRARQVVLADSTWSTKELLGEF